MNVYYITGTSRGIGKAMAEFLLREKGNEEVKKFTFSYHGDAKKIWLINNAGIISKVRYCGRNYSDSIIADFNVNLVSPALLMNKFMSVFADSPAEKFIINVSSGAGKNPIDGWSTYCSAKAGLDMYSRVVDLEQKTGKTGFRIFSIAPGIVDTRMQDEIRKSDPENFSRIEDFKNYKNTHQLSDPLLVAKKYFSILANPENLNQPVFSLKDYP
jgi:benzil reductase ((S)-benzoin forming)